MALLQRIQYAMVWALFQMCCDIAALATWLPCLDVFVCDPISLLWLQHSDTAECNKGTEAKPML